MSESHLNCTCWRCGADCYDVIERFPEGHEREGEARRVGAMLPIACQVEFMLNDASVLCLSMCLSCAGALTQEEYFDLNQKVHRAWAASLEGRPDRDALVKVHRDKTILGKVGQRREAIDWKGRHTELVIDRGGSDA